MRWHYTEKDEWPVNCATVMVRTLKEFDGMIPAFFVQKQMNIDLKHDLENLNMEEAV